jgi:RimJ/RimL family protein N-acetyltransferase
MSELDIRQKVIETPRLELHHLTGAEVISLFEDPENSWIYKDKSYRNPYRQLIDDSGPLAWRVPQVKADPSVNKWFVRWIVLKSTNEIIGSSSFHGAPNENGMIEIGLGIQPEFQNLGFGFETLTGMWGWAGSQEGVKILRYTVSKTNLPSIALVNKFGFTRTGEQLDEIDGPEEIYEMNSVEFAQMHFSS